MTIKTKNENLIGFSYTSPLVFLMLKPQPDITAYELAKILEYFQFGISGDILKQMPDELKRHFETVSG